MRSTRAKARQNLQVATVNTALERELLGLEPEPGPKTTFEFELGGLPVIAYVAPGPQGADVWCQAIVCPTDLGRRFRGAAILHERWKFGGALAHFWLERLAGKYLQAQSSDGYHGFA
jgi:hypothetical protein